MSVHSSVPTHTFFRKALLRIAPKCVSWTRFPAVNNDLPFCNTPAACTKANPKKQTPHALWGRPSCTSQTSPAWKDGRFCSRKFQLAKRLRQNHQSPAGCNCHHQAWGEGLLFSVSSGSVQCSKKWTVHECQWCGLGEGSKRQHLGNHWRRCQQFSRWPWFLNNFGLLQKVGLVRLRIQMAFCIRFFLVVTWGMANTAMHSIANHFKKAWKLSCPFCCSHCASPFPFPRSSTLGWLWSINWSLLRILFAGTDSQGLSSFIFTISNHGFNIRSKYRFKVRHWELKMNTSKLECAWKNPPTLAHWLWNLKADARKPLNGKEQSAAHKGIVIRAVSWLPLGHRFSFVIFVIFRDFSWFSKTSIFVLFRDFSWFFVPQMK